MRSISKQQELSVLAREAAAGWPTTHSSAWQEAGDLRCDKWGNPGIWQCQEEIAQEHRSTRAQESWVIFRKKRHNHSNIFLTWETSKRRTLWSSVHTQFWPPNKAASCFYNVNTGLIVPRNYSRASQKQFLEIVHGIETERSLLRLRCFGIIFLSILDNYISASF